MTKPLWLLFPCWLLIGVCLFSLSAWHPTQACSPDSFHYLQMAADWRAYNGTFPPGYSILIAGIAYSTHLPLLWASKLLNWLAVGVSGLLWLGRAGAERATVLMLVWLLPGNLRMITYTWSETVFIVLLLEIVWAIHRWEQNPTKAQAFRIALLMAGLVWMRYVGLFLYIGLALRWVIHRVESVKHPNSPRINLGQPFMSGLLMVGFLFGLNLYLTGYWFGGTRLSTVEPWPEWFRMLGYALLNELLLYNLRAGASSWWLIGVLLVQLGLMIGISQSLRKKPDRLSPPDQKLIRWLARVGSLYFLTLFLLRALSPFDPLNERLMAPGSMCWLLAVVWWIQSQHSIISRSPERAEIRTNPS